jgi:cyclohexanecarboxyl-CoA dehydrogenase
MVPEEYGGQGDTDFVSMGLVVEELARVDFPICHIPIFNGVGLRFLLRHGHPDLRDEWVPRCVRGEAMLCLCVTEPGTGTDAGALSLNAEIDGDTVVLRGEKTSVTAGMAASGAIVLARTASGGARGVSAFFVPLDLPGISRSAFRDMGMTGIGRATISFNDVRVPTANLLGELNGAFKLLMHDFDYTRVLVGVSTLAAAQASLGETIDYVRERSAFGRSLATYEGVAFPIVEHWTMMEAARLLCFKALYLRDQQRPHTKYASAVKWWVPRMCVEVMEDCMLLHGHYGYSADLPLQQRIRDVLGFMMADGTPQIQKVILAREIIGREFSPMS